MKNISRRTFLKGALAGIAGLAGTALTGCRFNPPLGSSLSEPNFEREEGRYGDISTWDTPNTPLVNDPAVMESQENATAWDPQHQLKDIQLSFDGELELPVVGATGYASIDLYLWSEMPTGNTGKVGTYGTYASPDITGTTPAATPSDPAVPSPPATSDFDYSGMTGLPGMTGMTGSYDGAGGSSAVTLSTAVPLSAAVPLSGSAPKAAAKLTAGTAFVVIAESGDWWLVRTTERAGAHTGWIEHRYCFINLPDVIPSMVYNDTNAYSSVFRTSGKDIPDITDRPLYYNNKTLNSRLGREEFLMPVLYAMAKKICQAQHNALLEGNTLVLIEGFRPKDTQITVANAVSKLASVDADVRRGISTSPWSISWFIATGVSNHQQGYAMDVTLAKVTDAEIQTISGHNVVNVKSHEYYTMPAPIHELSMMAATFTRPVTILSKTAWQSATMSATMAANDPAKALQRYCTSAAMTPLASEWWHFNDIDAFQRVSSHTSTGNFIIEDCCSLPEELATNLSV